MRIYLDNCCLNRPFDNQTQPRIRLESEAVKLIMDDVAAGRHEWVASEVLLFEISKAPADRRQLNLELVQRHANLVATLEPSDYARAEEIQRFGLKALDALHVSCAEANDARLFLTTDERLLRVANRHRISLKIRVINPVDTEDALDSEE